MITEKNDYLMLQHSSLLAIIDIINFALKIKIHVVIMTITNNIIVYSINHQQVSIHP